MEQHKRENIQSTVVLLFVLFYLIKFIVIYPHAVVIWADQTTKKWGKFCTFFLNIIMVLAELLTNESSFQNVRQRKPWCLPKFSPVEHATDPDHWNEDLLLCAMARIVSKIYLLSVWSGT